jgi:hypothetical protein
MWYYYGLKTLCPLLCFIVLCLYMCIVFVNLKIIVRSEVNKNNNNNMKNNQAIFHLLIHCFLFFSLQHWLHLLWIIGQNRNFMCKIFLFRIYSAWEIKILNNVWPKVFISFLLCLSNQNIVATLTNAILINLSIL